MKYAEEILKYAEEILKYAEEILKYAEEILKYAEEILKYAEEILKKKNLRASLLRAAATSPSLSSTIMSKTTSLKILIKF